MHTFYDPQEKQLGDEGVFLLLTARHWAMIP
jgi:hypothetical protein